MLNSIPKFILLGRYTRTMEHLTNDFRSVCMLPSFYSREKEKHVKPSKTFTLRSKTIEVT
jgi:hypothetical protein